MSKEKGEIWTSNLITGRARPPRGIIRKWLAFALGAAATLIFPGVALCDQSSTTVETKNIAERILSNTEVTAHARARYFNNHFQNVLSSRKAYSFGGWIGAKTARYKGFQVGLTEYTAQSLGLNDDNPRFNDVTLPSRDVTTLGKAYLSFKSSPFDLKIGRQAIDTPYANSADLRMIPLLFQGVKAVYRPPVKGLSLNAYRINRFKPYNEDNFIRGDSGRRDDPALTNPPAKSPSINSDGFFATGVKYKGDSVAAQAWYYDMYDRIEIGYGGIELTWPQSFAGVKPFGGLQYAREWNDDEVATYYRNAHSELYGAKLGVKSKNDIFYLAYNKVPVEDGAARGGGFISPYQNGGYNFSANYTRQPIQSLITNQQPGDAFAVRNIFHIKKFRLISGYTHFNLDDATTTAAPLTDANVNAGFAIAAYSPVKDLTLQLQQIYISSDVAVPGDIYVTRLGFDYDFF